jgi:protein-S-isoprenylcysteine O-methyltransferase Ste14
MRIFHWLLFALAALEVAIFILVAKSTGSAWPPMRIFGACLLPGVLFWVAVARVQLGSSFSVTPQARRLVTRGLYSRFRNPIYVATPFLFIGFALVIAKWWPLLLLVVVIPVQIVRARREADVLRAAFGAEYEA